VCESEVDRDTKLLESQGLDLDALCGEDAEGARVKVVCVAPDMKASLRELDAVTRDQVVMVRVDEQTSRTLDAWVETGAVRSRSEAAALFIREGLKVRAEELERLRDALREVEDAKRRLREKARAVLGDDRPE
jgi:Arc/MetJ-type ribon-helix-helix transcriptional regulator